jgi:membrane-bound ClpP family serine protease
MQTYQMYYPTPTTVLPLENQQHHSQLEEVKLDTTTTPSSSTSTHTIVLDYSKLVPLFDQIHLDLLWNQFTIVNLLLVLIPYICLIVERNGPPFIVFLLTILSLIISIKAQVTRSINLMMVYLMLCGGAGCWLLYIWMGHRVVASVGASTVLIGFAIVDSIKLIQSYKSTEVLPQ